MEQWYIFLICAIAGIGAGVATGFAGLSAAVFISPMLVTFLGVPVYEAIGIALASDVLASAMSSFEYWRNKNVNIKRGLPLMVSIIVFTIIGSVLAYLFTSSEFGDSALGYWSILGSIGLGLKFIFRPVRDEKKAKKSKVNVIILSIFSGAFIGFICGFQGVGGGMWMLMALTILLGYEFKKAVGTSVFIMSFTALIGAVSHFLIYGALDYFMLIICVVFTLVFAFLASYVANKIHVVKTNRVTGGLIFVSAALMLVINIYNNQYSYEVVKWIIIIVSILVLLFIGLEELYGIFFMRRTLLSTYFLKSSLNKEEKKRRKEEAKKIIKLPHETWKLINGQGISVRAEYFKTKDENKKLAIIVAGYRSKAIENATRFFDYYKNKGFDILIPYNQASGKSGGAIFCFDEVGRKDLVLWIEKAKENLRDDIEMLVHGTSMGGSIGLRVLDKDIDNLKLVISDSAYLNLDKVMSARFTFIYRFLYYIHLFLTNIKLKECDVTNEVMNAKVPFVLIHGKEDSVVPYQTSEEIYNLNKDKGKLHIFEECGHIEAVSKKKDEYFKVLDENILECFGSDYEEI